MLIRPAASLCAYRRNVLCARYCEGLEALQKAIFSGRDDVGEAKRYAGRGTVGIGRFQREAMVILEDD